MYSPSPLEQQPLDEHPPPPKFFKLKYKLTKSVSKYTKGMRNAVPSEIGLDLTKKIR